MPTSSLILSGNELVDLWVTNREMGDNEFHLEIGIGKSITYVGKMTSLISQNCFFEIPTSNVMAEEEGYSFILRPHDISSMYDWLERNSKYEKNKEIKIVRKHNGINDIYMDVWIAPYTKLKVTLQPKEYIY